MAVDMIQVELTCNDFMVYNHNNIDYSIDTVHVVITLLNQPLLPSYTHKQILVDQATIYYNLTFFQFIGTSTHKCTKVNCRTLNSLPLL